jgi:hypothetical protein
MVMPGMYFMTRGDFYIGDRLLLFPSFLQHDLVWYATIAAWGTLLALFLTRTAREWLDGRLVLPRVLILALAVPIALYVPTLENLDVAFQGMNAWHSFQYLALIWFVSRQRTEAGETSLSFVTRITRPGAFPLFYGFALGLTLLAGGTILLLAHLAGFEYEKSYYLVVLSFLLVHYAFDHLLFQDYRDFKA